MTVSKDIIVEAPHGLHMRPATVFAKAAKEFESNVTITADGKTVSAKSPMKIISLSLAKGTPIVLTCEGADEEKALESLSALINTLE